ncbi:MAG: MBL fold metallo-hydrolase [Desulfobacteraceae bacterium]|jgi:L-ascorbate metabolism protein UlaG (beta-lactamase superfamily)|nr:MAG: MBL fold metallo-hydrolase [Desulfobacteraceae bacterium]
MTPKRVRTISVAVFCALLKGLAAVAIAAQDGENLEDFVKGIHWLGHDAFRIEAGGKVIYIDPWKISGGPPADIIMITHDHFDHCSPEDVAKVRGKNSHVIAVQAAASRLAQPVTVVKPGDSLTVEGVRIKVVPAYNVNKFKSPGVPFHPKEAGNAGYIFTVSGISIYHPGDTDHIPEMASIKADIAFLPVSGIYVMTVEEAASLAEQIRPRMAIPMHVGRGIGSLEDAERFKNKASVPVKILPME